MSTELDASRGAVLQAVMRRFPAHAQAIELLTKRDERFREICEELAAAERALECTRNAPEPLRREREEEWQGLIERLTAQLAEALLNKNVIPIGRRARPP